MSGTGSNKVFDVSLSARVDLHPFGRFRDSYPHLTAALAELRGITLTYDGTRRNSAEGGVNADVVALSQRFAMLMGEYNVAIEDGKITVNEAKRLLRETLELQRVLLDMKLHLEEESVS